MFFIFAIFLTLNITDWSINPSKIGNYQDDQTATIPIPLPGLKYESAAKQKHWIQIQENVDKYSTLFSEVSRSVDLLVASKLNGLAGGDVNRNIDIALTRAKLASHSLKTALHMELAFLRETRRGARGEQINAIDSEKSAATASFHSIRVILFRLKSEIDRARVGRPTMFREENRAR